MNRFGPTTRYQSFQVGTMIPNVMRDNVAEQDTIGESEGFTPHKSDSPFSRTREKGARGLRGSWHPPLKTYP